MSAIQMHGITLDASIKIEVCHCGEKEPVKKFETFCIIQ